MRLSCIGPIPASSMKMNAFSLKILSNALTKIRYPVALTPEEALDELDVRGFVAITVGDIRAVHNEEHRCGVIRKTGDPGSGYLEITGITTDTAMGFASSLAARAGRPVERPDHRQRIRGSS